MDVADGCRVTEIARTADQFLARLVLQAIVAADDVTDEVRRFALRAGVGDLSEIDEHSRRNGDDPKALVSLSVFRANTPLETMASPETYDGDFPTGDFRDPSWCDRSCSLELDDTRTISWPQQIPRPAWLQPDHHQSGFFASCISAGNLPAAWLCLNSSGWHIAEARRAIRQLAKAARDPCFKLLSKAWLSVADKSAGGY